mmetsp:Transcript_599/g.931  ORF Transcript_599/g.931 Transcript_599/m.931 type:complete len:603 (-) Transcript_599:178-1986(-)
MITRQAAAKEKQDAAEAAGAASINTRGSSTSSTSKSPLYSYVIILSILTCAKILLASSTTSLYRSTDFDVHRNWLALTRHVPLKRWYYDDVDGTTVHTLDYPPLFAYFEYMLSSNPITDLMIANNVVDERCFALLGDDDNAPSDACVMFQRMTVIISDIVLYVAAWFAAKSVIIGAKSSEETMGGVGMGMRVLVTASLIVCNPGLLVLDHVHFQYNGMLLGLLLLSIGCIARKADRSASKGSNWRSEIQWDLLGAFFYAVLLGMKHLYLLLGPLYFVYLLRRYCFVRTNDCSKGEPSFSFERFLALAVVTGSTLVLPYLPILLSTDLSDRTGQLLQIFRRLFPFQRGLCHDYWAANIWAIYLFANKCFRFVLGRLGSILPESLESISLPEVPPSVCALLLMLGLSPSMRYAWKAASSMLTEGSVYCDQSRSFFVTAVVFSSFSGFMLAYHVHEKAIMTAILPLTLLSTQSRRHAQLYLRTSALGHFGLLPLLYQPAELGLKTVTYVAFLAASVWALKITAEGTSSDGTGKGKSKLTNTWDRAGLIALLVVYVFMEIVHPLLLASNEKLEFLPLLMTSVFCAVGLMACWFLSFAHLRDSADSI